MCVCVCVCVYIYIYINICIHIFTPLYIHMYGVATINRLLNIIGLFCRILSLLQGSFAKETYSCKEPTSRSQPMSQSRRVRSQNFIHICVYIKYLLQYFIHICVNIIYLLQYFTQICVYIIYLFHTHFMNLKYYILIYHTQLNVVLGEFVACILMLGQYIYEEMFLAVKTRIKAVYEDICMNHELIQSRTHASSLVLQEFSSMIGLKDFCFPGGVPFGNPPAALVTVNPSTRSYTYVQMHSNAYIFRTSIISIVETFS